MEIQQYITLSKTGVESDAAVSIFEKYLNDKLISLVVIAATP